MKMIRNVSNMILEKLLIYKKINYNNITTLMKIQNKKTIIIKDINNKIIKIVYINNLIVLVKLNLHLKITVINKKYNQI